MYIGKTKILDEDLKVDQPIQGEKYHTSWAKRGCVWKFTGFDAGGMCLLETPKSRKLIKTSITSLRHINRNALNNAQKRLKDGNE